MKTDRYAGGLSVGISLVFCEETAKSESMHGVGYDHEFHVGDSCARHRKSPGIGCRDDQDYPVERSATVYRRAFILEVFVLQMQEQIIEVVIVIPPDRISQCIVGRIL